MTSADDTGPASAGSPVGAAGGAGAPQRGGAGRAVLWASLAIGAVMIGFIALLATRETQQGQINSTAIEGQVAPLLTAPTLDGTEVVLEDLRGSWVLVNFFATWCPGCVAEHPELVDFSERHAATRDAHVVSVLFGDEPERVAEFFEMNGGDWPVVVDEVAARRFVLEFGVTAVPETYIISPAGRVVKKLVSNAGVTADALDRFLGLDAGPDGGLDGGLDGDTDGGGG